jgi:hypothetical protein
MTGCLPNFLIVGAAKAGTTSLYHYLRQHPDVFMSAMKEPSFFYAQCVSFPLKGMEPGRKALVTDFDSYRALFRDGQGRKAVGEASVDTLYYHAGTIPLVRRYLGRPRVIAILRDPVERAYSAYMFLRRDGREPLTFEEALAREPERHRDDWRMTWLYVRAGMYFEQVRAFRDAFPDVGIWLYEDLRDRPADMLREIFAFLDVDNGFSPDTRVRHNVSGLPRWEWFNNLLARPSSFQRACRAVGTRLFGYDRWCALRESVRNTNLSRRAPDPATAVRLRAVFRDDILRLQDLIGRDLKAWLPR